MEKKFRDGVLVFMNDRRDKSADNKRKSKEVSGSHTISKRRSVKKKNEQVQTTESPSTVDEGVSSSSSKDDDDMELEETPKDDSSEEMDIGSFSNNEQCVENIQIICIFIFGIIVLFHVRSMSYNVLSNR